MSATPVGQLDTLRRQIAATHARFTALGARMARAAQAIATTGTLPPDALLREIQDAAHEFHVVRVAVLDAAAALELLPRPRPREIASLRDLAPIMDAVLHAADQASRRRQLDAARAPVFGVLNRVSAVVHRDGHAFTPLSTCQDKARALRTAVAGCVPVDLQLEVRAWARAIRPFAALLALIEDPAAVDRARRSKLEETVAAAFGHRLATAAANDMLTLA